MKTHWMIIAGILLVFVIGLMPMATVQAAGGDQTALQACEGNQPQGGQQGLRDGTRGQNAPRDGRGQGLRNGQGSNPRRGEGRGNSPQDGSGNGPRQGQRKGPQDGTGPGCPNA